MVIGSRLFGAALLAAFSVLAATAVGVQADPLLEDEVYINGGSLLANDLPILGEGGTSKINVPSLKLTIECKKTLVSGTILNMDNMAHISAHLLYHECVPSGAEKFCKIYPTAADRAAKTNAGLILETVLFLAALHPAGTLYLVATPLLGNSSIGTIYMSKSTEGCTLPPENTLTGSIAYRVPQASMESVEHEIVDISDAEEALLKELSIISGLAYGANSASPEGGNGKLHLGGGGTGATYSFK